MTTSRVRLAAAAALAVAAVALALVLAGGAGGDDGAQLAWKDVEVYPSEIKTDKVLAGRLANTSLRDVDLDVDDVRVFDADGARVQHAVVFLQAFAHGLYAWSQRPKELGDFERRRIGQIVTIKPGRSAPITLSWRVPKGGAQPATVDFGLAVVKLPEQR